MIFFRFLSLPAIALMVWSCASSSFTAPSGYIGSVEGQYATVFYRVEDSQLLIAIQNTTIYPMSNLVVVVNQSTAGGGTERQSSVRLLRIREVYHMTLPIAPGATGEVTVTYYFRASNVGIGMSPFGSNAGSEAVDTVAFKMLL